MRARQGAGGVEIDAVREERFGDGDRALIAGAGAGAVAEVGARRMALRVTDLDVGRRQLALQRAIVGGFARQRIEVADRRANHHAARLGRARDVHDRVVDVEDERLRQPAHVGESAFGARRAPPRQSAPARRWRPSRRRAARSTAAAALRAPCDDAARAGRARRRANVRARRSDAACDDARDRRRADRPSRSGSDRSGLERARDNRIEIAVEPRREAGRGRRARGGTRRRIGTFGGRDRRSGCPGDRSSSCARSAAGRAARQHVRPLDP